MSVWSSIGGAICVAVTVVGLGLSWRLWRKSGATRGIRGVAWSLLPLAAYLTGAVGLLGRLVNAIVRFAGGFVFSPKSWAGVIVVGVAVLLFLTSGGLPLLNWRKARERRKAAAAASRDSDSRAAVPAARRRGGAQAADPPAVGAPAAQGPAGAGDDDLSDVQEILRRRGIK
jgi:hypothetical protein